MSAADVTGRLPDIGGSQESSRTVPAGHRKRLATRVAIATVVALVVGFGAVWLFENTTDFLTLMLATVFLGSAMLPAVDRLSARGWRRGVAAGVVMVASLLLGGAFVVLMLSIVVGQLIDAAGALPEYADQVTGWLSSSATIEGIEDESASIEAYLRSNWSSVLEGALGVTTGVVGLFFRGLTIALFLYYMLADFPKLRAALFSRLPPERQLVAATVADITVEKVGGYVYSRALLAAASAAFHLVVFMVVDLPYPFALAMWMGIISQFVPTIGTYLASALPIIVALLEEPLDVVWVLIAIVIYQQVENYLLAPRLTADTMELHPAVAFGSVIIGSSLLGGLGALIAIPFAATVSALIGTYLERYQLVEEATEQFRVTDYVEGMEAVARQQKREEEARLRMQDRMAEAPQLQPGTDADERHA